MSRYVPLLNFFDCCFPVDICRLSVPDFTVGKYYRQNYLEILKPSLNFAILSHSVGNLLFQVRNLCIFILCAGSSALPRASVSPIPIKVDSPLWCDCQRFRHASSGSIAEARLTRISTRVFIVEKFIVCNATAGLQTYSLETISKIAYNPYQIAYVASLRSFNLLSGGIMVYSHQTVRQLFLSIVFLEIREF